VLLKANLTLVKTKLVHSREAENVKLYKMNVFYPRFWFMTDVYELLEDGLLTYMLLDDCSILQQRLGVTREGADKLVQALVEGELEVFGIKKRYLRKCCDCCNCCCCKKRGFSALVFRGDVKTVKKEIEKNDDDGSTVVTSPLASGGVDDTSDAATGGGGEGGNRRGSVVNEEKYYHDDGDRGVVNTVEETEFAKRWKGHKQEREEATKKKARRRKRHSQAVEAAIAEKMEDEMSKDK
jgi:hypothetical protein